MMPEDPRYYAILTAVEDMDADGTLVDPNTVLHDIVVRLMAALDEMDEPEIRVVVGDRLATDEEMREFGYRLKRMARK